METLLSSQLGGDPILGLQTEPGDQPPRPSTGSAKADAPVLVLETALGLTPGLCMWLLDSGKRFILLTRMEWKEMAQSWGSAWSAPVLLPPPLPAPPPLRSPPHQMQGGNRTPRDSLELLAPLAGSWVRSCVGRGVWVLAGPGASQHRGTVAHRCLRSACWSRRERSSMRTFLSWSRCSKRLTFICRTWGPPRSADVQTSCPLPSIPSSIGPNSPHLPCVPSPAQSPVRPTALAPFQPSGGPSLGRHEAPRYMLDAGALAAGLPWSGKQLSAGSRPWAPPSPFQCPWARTFLPSSTVPAFPTFPGESSLV